jgi:hypothetical protein
VSEDHFQRTFFRSTIQNQPFLTIATSPDFNHPSAEIDSFVACGLRQYPKQTFGPRT